MSTKQSYSATVRKIDRQRLKLNDALRDMMGQMTAREYARRAKIMASWAQKIAQSTAYLAQLEAQDA